MMERVEVRLALRWKHIKQCLCQLVRVGKLNELRIATGVVDVAFVLLRKRLCGEVNHGVFIPTVDWAVLQLVVEGLNTDFDAIRISLTCACAEAGTASVHILV